MIFGMIFFAYSSSMHSMSICNALVFLRVFFGGASDWEVDKVLGGTSYPISRMG